MHNFKFLLENENFIGVDDLTNRPMYQGFCYRYLTKLDDKMYNRLNIVIQENNKKVLFVQEIGTMENEKFEPIGLGLAINPDINKTPNWFQELFVKTMKMINSKMN